MTDLSFFVEGNPATKGSLKVIHAGGKAHLIPDNKNEKNWRSQIADTIKTEMVEKHITPFPAQTPIVVALMFHLPRPKTVKRPLPSVKPDLDKLVRCVFDAITDSGLWSDDGCVTSVFASKQYVDKTPGITIVLTDLIEKG